MIKFFLACVIGPVLLAAAHWFLLVETVVRLVGVLR